jgi:hypothetical protein
MTLGFNVESGNHFTLSANLVTKIQNAPLYETLGGDREFDRYVNIYDQPIDDVIIIDDDNPIIEE